MRKLLMCAVALGLAATAPAYAQDNDRDNRHHRQHQGDHDRNDDGDHDRNGGDHDTVRGNVTIHNNGNVTVRGHARVDVGRFRAVIRAPHRFRVGVWHAPRGFHYRRFVLGERVPRILLAPTFYLTAYSTYGLLEPPEGFVWVRVGPDAVLVDTETGEVIRVVYGVFY